MAILFNTRISDTYQSLLKTIDNTPLGAPLKEMTDGAGNSTGLHLNTAGSFRAEGTISLGSLDSLQIYHDGVDNNIKGFGGTLKIAANNLRLNSTDGDENMAQFIRNGGTKLYFDNSLTFQTTATGIGVTGEIVATGSISLPSGANVNFGDTLGLVISHSGNNSSIKNIGGLVGDLFIDNLVDDKDIILRSDNGAGSVTNYIVCDGSNGSVLLNHYGDLKLETTTAGVDAYGTVNIYDPVSLTDRVRIYNDGATSYIDSPNNPLQMGVDSFIIKGTDGVTNMIAANSAGGVSLYHVGGQKLYTKTNGIAVTGTIQQLTDPSAAQDAATKNYVDNAVSGVDLTGYLLNTTDTFTGTLTVTGNIDVTGHISDALNNTFIGKDSGSDNTTGTKNVAIGYESLIRNTTGSNNVAIGNLSTRVNTEGFNNVAIGRESLWSNTTGANGIAFGSESLKANTTGAGNIGLGTAAINKNTTGSYNIGLGYGAGQWIADGITANETGNNSIFIGKDTRASADGLTNQIVIGDSAIGAGSNTVTLGNDSITDTYLKGNVNITGKLDLDDGAGNTFVGSNAGADITTGTNNTAVGYQSLKANIDGFQNVAVGYQSLKANIDGVGNVAVGGGALTSNTAGDNNVAIGRSSLRDATIANNNTAIGVDTLAVNLDGGSNTAVGHRSLYVAAGATENTAVGKDSLTDVTTGNGNTAVGYGAGANTTTGESNTAVGYQSLFSNLDGRFNVGLGFNALNLNTTGDSNVALGKQSLYAIVGDENIGIGKDAGRFAVVGNKEIGSRNIFIGADTKSALTGSTLNEIVIGDGAEGNGSNTVTLGNDSITNTYLKGDVTITGSLLADGVARYVDTELTSAQLLDLHNTPVELIPARGAGTVILVDRIFAEYTFVTTAYTQSGNRIVLPVYYGTDGSLQAFDALDRIETTEDYYESKMNNTDIFGNPTTIANLPVTFKGFTPMTGGDGTVKVRVYYSVIPSTF